MSMPSRFVALNSTIAAVVVAAFMFLGAGPLAGSQNRPAGDRDSSLKQFLQRYVGLPPDEIEKGTRYSAAFVDLRDEGDQEVIVYLSSDGWCGTGGCTLLILAPEGTSYRVVTKVPATDLPIRIFATKSNGWKNIGVVKRMGAVQPAREAVLSFDGRTYRTNRTNPSVHRSHPSDRNVQGTIVMAETAEDKPLY
jgi:hypothetical protein